VTNANTSDVNGQIVERVKLWLDSFVIDLDLCPFARDAQSQKKLLEALKEELGYLKDNPQTSTTLLIHPAVLNDFLDYNQFLDQADALLEKLNLVGEFQIASFHPDYQFADTEPEDAENYTNRSPCPLLHILRESDVEHAVTTHPNSDDIPAANIAKLRAMGKASLKSLFLSLYS